MKSVLLKISTLFLFSALFSFAALAQDASAEPVQPARGAFPNMEAGSVLPVICPTCTPGGLQGGGSDIGSPAQYEPGALSGTQAAKTAK